MIINPVKEMQSQNPVQKSNQTNRWLANHLIGQSARASATMQMTMGQLKIGSRLFMRNNETL